MFPEFIPGVCIPNPETVRMLTPQNVLNRVSMNMEPRYEFVSSLFAGDQNTRQAVTSKGDIDQHFLRPRFLVPLVRHIASVRKPDIFTVYLDEWLSVWSAQLTEVGAQVFIMPHPVKAIGISWRLLSLANKGWKIIVDADMESKAPSEMAVIRAARDGNYDWVRMNNMPMVPGFEHHYLPICGNVATSHVEPAMRDILAEFIDSWPAIFADEVERRIIPPKPASHDPMGYGFDEQFLARWAYPLCRQQRTVCMSKRAENAMLLHDMHLTPETTWWWV